MKHTFLETLHSRFCFFGGGGSESEDDSLEQIGFEDLRLLELAAVEVWVGEGGKGE